MSSSKKQPKNSRILLVRGKPFLRHVWRPVTGLKQLYQCATKLGHTNYLSALAHVASLRKVEPDAHFNIYACRFCDQLHVGHCKNGQWELDETYEDFREAA